MKYTISIIVPAYNEEKFIKRTLDSLGQQQTKPYEIIVVDNNSTDKTAAIAKKYTSQVITEKKKGYHYAINAGIRHARGTIITVCDADTIYPPNWLTIATETFAKHPGCAAVYGTDHFSDGNIATRYIGSIVHNVFSYVSRFVGVHITAGNNFLYRKSAYTAVGGIDPIKHNFVGMDWDLGRRLQTVGEVVFNPRLIVTTSARKSTKQGSLYLATIYITIWTQLLRGKKPTINYDTYNA